MSTPASTLRLRWAQLQEGVGWAGVIGIAMIFAAGIALASSYQTHRSARTQLQAAAAMATPTTVREQSKTPAPDIRPLPNRSEWAYLLTYIQQTVVGQGIAWPSADYKILAATDTAPAALEVRCALRGTYPQLRGVIAELLGSVPGLAIRDLSMTRLSTESPEVEAKLSFVVFLRDGPASTPALTEKTAP